jgi:hypothetical protein
MFADFSFDLSGYLLASVVGDWMVHAVARLRLWLRLKRLVPWSNRGTADLSSSTWCLVPFPVHKSRVLVLNEAV